METKVCKICGKQKEVTEFYLMRNGNPEPKCKECKNERARMQRRVKKDSENIAFRSVPEPKGTSDLARFKPCELIDELRKRGYKGTLSFTQKIEL